MERPLFSCVIPVKGERLFLSAALASLRPEVQGIAARGASLGFRVIIACDNKQKVIIKK